VTAIEVVLSHERGRWRARGAGIDVAHEALREIDACMLRVLAREPGMDRAHVRFDLDALPVWLRQYQAHYCNYVLRARSAEASP